jgi:hypothetical protein
LIGYFVIGSAKSEYRIRVGLQQFKVRIVVACSNLPTLFSGFELLADPYTGHPLSIRMRQTDQLRSKGTIAATGRPFRLCRIRMTTLFVSPLDLLPVAYPTVDSLSSTSNELVCFDCKRAINLLVFNHTDSRRSGRYICICEEHSSPRSTPDDKLRNRPDE